MCYLKNLNSIHPDHQMSSRKQTSITSQSNSQLEQKRNNNEQSINHCQQGLICPCIQKFHGLPWNSQQLNMINLFSLINKNNNIIDNLHQKLTNVEQKLTEGEEEPTNIKVQEDIIPSSTAQKQMEHSIKNRQLQLFQKLFSNFCPNKPQLQKYKLVLVNHVDHKFYKQRNFELKIKLTSSTLENQTLKNGNLLNLCVGIFNNEGEWITENKAGQPILKGKTQIQLYNGEAIFKKLFFREISSLFPGNKLNMVIYVRPSSIKYENMTHYSEHIEWDDVYPLFIRNIKVLSRKKTVAQDWILS